MFGGLLFRERLRCGVGRRIRALLRVPVFHLVSLLLILLREVPVGRRR